MGQQNQLLKLNRNMLYIGDKIMIKQINICGDCGIDINASQEYAFIVKIWQLGFPPFLCVGCLEYRLGRQLVADDFDWNVPLTFMGCFARSERLISRMTEGKFNSITLNELCTIF